jgi:hypothetical protein
MAREGTSIVAAAGEHFVAFRLAQLGYVVAIPRGGSPAVDLLVSDRSGKNTVTIQVKTTEWAGRERGRGESRRLHEVQFPLGHKAAKLAGDRFFYVFVDLRGREPTSVPDVYVVPCSDIIRYCDGWSDDAALVRWHMPVGEVENYKNSWSPIRDVLDAGV